MQKVSIGLLVLTLVTSVSFAGKTELDPDGGIRLDGERWFPLGIYDLPETATDFQRFSEAGFDLVRGKAETAFLDSARDHGFQVWIALGGYSEVPDEAARLKLQAHIRPIQDHPALAIWEHPDEALWNCEQIAREVNGQEREELRKKVNDHIRSGTGDAELLKDLYRKMSREFAFRNWSAVETHMAELWAALGEEGRNSASGLAGTFDREKVLYQNLLEGYRTLRKADPNHLVWQNHAPRNSFDLLVKHAAYCDLIGCDIYPAPSNPANGHSDLSNFGLSSVGDYTERFERVAPEKGTLMVLQGFSWKALHGVDEAYAKTSKGREPTYIESRFMAYDSIVRGANGICYWGTNFSGYDSNTWKDLVPVIQELSSLQKYLAAPEIEVPVEVITEPSWWSLDRPIFCSAREVNGEWLFILVNEVDGAQKVRLTFPEHFAGRRLYFLYDGLYVDLAAGGQVPIEFGPLGVRLLSTDPNLEVPHLRGLYREVPNPFPAPR